ncbi:MAG: hypothetical protein GZ091_02695 [Paludibacter sp.]|nr:hypothetical protein [Paludibacter sp.]
MTNTQRTIIKIIFILVILFIGTRSLDAQSNSDYNIQVIKEFKVDKTIGKLRAVPVELGKDQGRGLLLVYSQDKEIDPYYEMFFYPKHPLVLAMYNSKGKQIWKKELNKGMVPGIWFCPVFPFDLNKDGVDEIWLNNTNDSEHPLGMTGYVLEKLNALTGKSEGQWPWHYPDNNQSNSHFFRNFIFGGYVHGEPVLITAQGTYGPMYIQAWNTGMKSRWNLFLPKKNTALGSHMSSVVDIDGDQSDEFMWGERCISMQTGKVVFLADSGVWDGHSDIIQPVLNKSTNRWSIFTCRESYYTDTMPPRVVLYDDHGNRVWKDIDFGHMDMGWCANLGENGESYSYALKIGNKVAGEKGFFRSGMDEFVFKTFTGEKVTMPFSLFNSIPVDFNGDGVHELVCALGEQGDRKIYNNLGLVLGDVGKDGIVAMASKFYQLPGEQILVYYPNGVVKIFADKNAVDTPAAKQRYESTFYIRNQKLTAVGYNLVNLGGL